MSLLKAFRPAYKHLASVIGAIADQLPEVERFRFAEQLSMAAYPKYKFSDFGRIWLDDQEFESKYRETMDPDNWHSLDRKFLLKEFLRQAPRGDFVECGVYKGASAFWLCRYAQQRVHLFDSFSGLPAPADKDGDWWTQGTFSDVTTSDVERNLRPYHNYQLYVGWIPTIFDRFIPRAISFLHIDVDLYQPTLDSITEFYSLLCPGAIVICDDYGFAQCPGAKLAMDEFFADKPEKVSLLPTGQGLVIKR